MRPLFRAALQHTTTRTKGYSTGGRSADIGLSNRTGRRKKISASVILAAAASGSKGGPGNGSEEGFRHIVDADGTDEYGREEALRDGGRGRGGAVYKSENTSVSTCERHRREPRVGLDDDDDDDGVIEGCPPNCIKLENTITVVVEDRV
jgi:hypothetical protein